MGVLCTCGFRVVPLPRPPHFQPQGHLQNLSSAETLAPSQLRPARSVPSVRKGFKIQPVDSSHPGVVLLPEVVLFMMLAFLPLLLPVSVLLS